MAIWNWNELNILFLDFIKYIESFPIFLVSKEPT